MKRYIPYGFTLVEMLFVVALIAILSTLSVSSYRDFQIQWTLKAVAAELEHSLSHARQTAISSKKDVYFTINQLGQCVGISFEQVCDCKQDSDCELAGVSTAKSFTQSPVHLEQLTLIRDHFIKFDARLGLAAGNNGSFSVASPSSSIRLIVSALGRSRLCLASGSVSGVSKC